ncbi:sulfotransferase family protein [Thermosulfurimonas dismutans]|nr:sulfotransferase [Thermosulfurimonas dismutans]
MAEILNKHPLIYSFNELHFFEMLYDPNDNSINDKKILNMLTKLYWSHKGSDWVKCNIDDCYNDALLLYNKLCFENKIEHPIEIYKNFLYIETQKMGKLFPCEQTPRNLFYLKEILQYFSDSKIIYMIRDPRAVLASQKNKWKMKFLGHSNMPLREAIRSWINYHPYTISKLWNSASKAIKPFLSHPNVLVVKFEELVNDPYRTIKKTCDFLEVEFYNEMLDVQLAGSSVYKKGKKGFRKEVISAWKNKGLNKTEIYICQEVNKKEMEFWGYDFEKVSPNYLFFVYYLITFPIKTSMALIFNLRRSKNIFNAMKRRLVSLEN